MIDEMGAAKLIDFGIACSVDPGRRMTLSGQGPGTPCYMAPEQLLGARADAASDVYSLALSIMQVMAGALPARDADGTHAVVVPAAVPPRVRQIFQRCLAAHPGSRYPNGERLLAALQASPAGRRVVARRWVRLSLVAAPAAVALAVAVSRIPALRSVDMVVIPGGEFVSGMDLDEVPEELRQVGGVDETLTRGGATVRRTGGFRIDRHEVTNEEYARFVRATGHRPPDYWRGATPPHELVDHPVVEVTLGDAEAYARWAGKRLPSADEWEKAARGGKGNLYPWGDEFVLGRCNTAESGPGATSSADAYPQDCSDYGVVGMGGNVTEWTASTIDCGGGVLAPLICGGSYLEGGWCYSLASMRRPAYYASYPDVGFRCAK
jgi:formylglycine-generating enzyme required for sulfatase activity